MSDPSFVVKERKDYLKLKQMETWKSDSSGPMPKHSEVVQFDTIEYNKPAKKEENKSEK